MYGQLAAETLTGNIWRQTPPGTPTNQPDGNLSISIASIGKTGFIITNIKGSLSGPSLLLNFASPALAQSAVDNRWSLLTITGTRAGQAAGWFYVTSVKLATSGATAQVHVYKQGGVTSTDRAIRPPPEPDIGTSEDPTDAWQPPDIDLGHQDPSEPVTAPSITPTIVQGPTTHVEPALTAGVGPEGDGLPWGIIAAAAAAAFFLGGR